MKRLYVRSQLGIVLVALIKEEEFEKTLFHLSTYPLQSFFYDTQGKELFGNELKREIDALIDYAKKNQRIFWYCEGNKKKVAGNSRHLKSHPCLRWKKYGPSSKELARQKRSYGKLVEITYEPVAIGRQGQRRE